MIEAIARSAFASPLGEARAVAATALPPQDFGSVLNALTSSAIGTVRTGEEAAAQGIIGAMPVQEVVEKVLAAERSMQAAIAIRDKLVGAYLEISRMQI